MRQYPRLQQIAGVYKQGGEPGYDVDFKLNEPTLLFCGTVINGKRDI